MTTNEKRLLHENAAILLLEVEEQEQYIKICDDHLKRAENSYYVDGKKRAESIKAERLEKYNKLIEQL
jgi:predicted transcriptional regulator